MMRVIKTFLIYLLLTACDSQVFIDFDEKNQEIDILTDAQINLIEVSSVQGGKYVRDNQFGDSIITDRKITLSSLSLDKENGYRVTVHAIHTNAYVDLIYENQSWRASSIFPLPSD